MTVELTPASGTRRIAAFLVDHFVFYFFIVAVFSFIPNGIWEHDWNTDKLFMLTILVMAVFFAKDSFRGISFGRWIMGIMVRDQNNTNNTPPFIALYFRNLLLCIWPIELITLWASRSKRRIGDMLFNTVVVENPQKAKRSTRILVLAISLAFCLLSAFYIAITGIKNTKVYDITITEISKNEEVNHIVGGIKEFGMVRQYNVQITNGCGHASLTIKVKGERQNIRVQAILHKEPGKEWELTEIIPYI